MKMAHNGCIHSCSCKSLAMKGSCILDIRGLVWPELRQQYPESINISSVPTVLPGSATAVNPQIKKPNTFYWTQSSHFGDLVMHY